MYLIYMLIYVYIFRSSEVSIFQIYTTRVYYECVLAVESIQRNDSLVWATCNTSKLRLIIGQCVYHIRKPQIVQVYVYTYISFLKLQVDFISQYILYIRRVWLPEPERNKNILHLAKYIFSIYIIRIYGRKIYTRKMFPLCVHLPA